MHLQQTPPVRPIGVLKALGAHPWRWVGPAVVVALAASVYAWLRPDTWEASQAMIVRNEAATSPEVPGKFGQPEEMKALQETLLELARSQSVLADALWEVGPPADRDPAAAGWPAPSDVADLREAVKLAPPKGAEFGKTEVFYLRVRAADRQRATDLAAAICGRLETGLQALRDAKARSMVAELEKTVSLAAGDLKESTVRLAEMETRVGSNLAELRLLQDAHSGESALRRTATEIRNELRQVSAVRQSNEELLRLLKEVQDQPDRLLATPHPLLESQPALRRLKDGLIDAQLSAAQLQGRLSEQHPLVLAARESQREILRRLKEELHTSTAGLEVDLRVNQNRMAMLEKQLAEATGQLEQLAGFRTPYAELVAETRKRTELLERAQQRLADARASQATARAASLVSRIDAPDAGTQPLGPSRAAIALLGLAGGLAAGVGVLFLTMPPAPEPAPPVGQPADEAEYPRLGQHEQLPPLQHPLTFKGALLRIASDTRSPR